jgi:hypothetical protein
VLDIGGGAGANLAHYGGDESVVVRAQAACLIERA